ncbi:MAG: hypothetical protein K9H26_15860 [Prolixibacteraceae bacterium]|nr:hypothetical protein [Prolixibacteraceae bacterium]
MEEKTMSEKESLELISSMIKKTQQNLENSNGRPFLIWGYTTVFVSLLVYFVVSKTNNYHYHLLWFLIPLIGITLMMLTRKKRDKKQHVVTFLAQAILKVWTVVGIAAMLVAVGSFFANIPILGIMLLLMGMGTMITGLLIRFNLIVISGIIGMLFSALPFVVQQMEQILIFGAIFLLIMVIPGHVLNYKSRKSHV